MHRIPFTFWLACLIPMFVSSAWAITGPQTLVVPNCLMSNSFQNEIIAKSQQLNLIRTDDLDAFHSLRMKKTIDCQGFINVTDAWKHNQNQDASEFLSQFLPNHNLDFTGAHHIQYQSSVNPLLTRLSTENVTADLKFLSQLPSRHVDTEEGLRIANWVKSELEKMLVNRPQNDVEVFSIPTINHSKQPSIVAKIGKSSFEPGILIGTHMDTLKQRVQKKLGISETGSGIVTMLETARVLINSPLAFKKPIYLVWYSGRDEGNLGSQSVVQLFNRQNVAVEAVLQIDDTGYEGSEPSIGLADELTDAGLTTFVADLVTTYLKLPVGIINCGFACSDHMTWHQNGSRVAYSYSTMHENELEKMTKIRNKFKLLSTSHILNFVKLAVAFSVELAEPVG